MKPSTFEDGKRSPFRRDDKFDPPGPLNDAPK